MKRTAYLIFICLLVGVSGCAGTSLIGKPIDNAARRAALLTAWRRPDMPKAIFRTVIRWGPRELSLVEIVKPNPQGGYSVAGITDVGNTLYAVQIDPAGAARVLSKTLPFSDRWLLEGPVAELLIPWKRPAETSRLHVLPDGAWALVDEDHRLMRMFVFDQADIWRELRLFSGNRLLVRVFLEWNGGPVPQTMRIDNRRRHYRAVREYLPGRCDPEQVFHDERPARAGRHEQLERRQRPGAKQDGSRSVRWSFRADTSASVAQLSSYNRPKDERRGRDSNPR